MLLFFDKTAKNKMTFCKKCNNVLYFVFYYIFISYILGCYFLLSSLLNSFKATDLYILSVCIDLVTHHSLSHNNCFTLFLNTSSTNLLCFQTFVVFLI